LCFQHGGAAILARLRGFGDNFCTLAGGIALHMNFGKKQRFELFNQERSHIRSL
jgi:hypothetical protein